MKTKTLHSQDAKKVGISSFPNFHKSGSISGRKSTTVLKLLCRNIAAGRFNWRRYCTPQTYFGQEICVTPLHCSYGQIGYTVHFPYSNMPEVEYDWEMGKLTVDEENWKEYFRHSEQ